jgi:hypothetical protein
MTKRPTSSEFEKLRLTTRSSKNTVSAITNFRRSSSLDILLRLGGQLGTHPAYKPLIWPAPFPKTLTAIPRSSFPYYLDFEREVAWTVNLLATASEELSAFVQERQRVELLFLSGNFDLLADSFARIESRFGTSLWLIENRMNCAHLKGGTTAVNQLVSPIFADERLAEFVGVIIAWFRCRVAATSAAEIDRLLRDYAPLEFGTHYLVHLIMGRCPPITRKNVGQILSHADQLPAVDRYHVLLLSLQALVANSVCIDDNNSIVIQGLKLLAESLDDILLRLVFAMDSDIQYLPTIGHFADALEHYSCGRYPDVVN